MYSNKKIQFSGSLFLLIIGFIVVGLYSGPVKLVLAFEFLVWVGLSLLMYLLSGRKYFSWISSLIIIVLLAEVSLLKQEYIGQKLYVSDFSNLLSETSILLGFASIKITALLAFLFLLSVVSFTYEPSIRRYFPFQLVVLVVVTALAWNIIKEKTFVWRWNVERYEGNLTMLVGEFFHPLILNLKNLPISEICCDKVNEKDIELKGLDDNSKPHIVTILLESQTNLDNLKNFQSWGSDWSLFSPSSTIVYAKGGGTWIQEYALLHGVNPTLYGESFYKINLLGPGKLDGRFAVSLKNRGYETASYLAYRKTVYNTEIFQKSLGIDKIIDCRDRGDCKRGGTNFGIDENMLNAMTEKLNESKNPQYLLSLTMTNHGPHSGDGLENLKTCPSGVSNALCGELNDYYQRSEKLKDLINKFVIKIKDLDRRTVVVFFGDHISPTLAANFKKEDYIDGKDNEAVLAIYDSAEKGFINIPNKIGICKGAIPSENIDAIALSLAGFTSIYTEKKLLNMKKC